jgi:hypothetical protein
MPVLGFGLEELRPDGLGATWFSTDHPELYACSTEQHDFSQPDQDYLHWNSLALEADGTYLISARHLDAVLKIDPADGSIAWILGGPCDQFGLTAGQRFSHQHHARRESDGRLSLLDNGNGTGRSRVLRLALDEVARTLDGSSPDRPAFTEHLDGHHLSIAMGSVQLFASGRALVGWGAQLDGGPDVTEFDVASGERHLSLTFHPEADGTPRWSYRALKAR